MNWQPDYDRIKEVVTGINQPDNPPFFITYQDRVNDWLSYIHKHRDLPSILITSSGYVVNGRHRLIAYREACKRIGSIRLYGTIVEFKNGDWVATGNLCLVK